MDQFRVEWQNLKRHLERQMTLLEPPAGMRTIDKNGNDTTEKSKERIRHIIKELDQLLKAHHP